MLADQIREEARRVYGAMPYWENEKATLFVR
jgi:hypothetical protein